MTEFNEEDMKNVLVGILKRADEELFSKTNDELEEYWFLSGMKVLIVERKKL